MTLAPEPGLVIRYDFLWQADEATGVEYGLKDRPCVVILVSSPRDDNARDVIVCPISHTPPDAETPAVEIPYKVARYLRLDPGRMWITTRQVNVFRWEDGRIPAPARAKAHGRSDGCRASSPKPPSNRSAANPH